MDTLKNGVHHIFPKRFANRFSLDTTGYEWYSLDTTGFYWTQPVMSGIRPYLKFMEILGK